MSNKIKILIVEHDKADLELMHHELKKGEINYEYEVVHNERGYVTVLKSFIPDIILSDYSLPSFNGPEIFEIKEEMAPDTPFIFVSGTIGEEKAVELIKSGVTDYTMKASLFTLPHKVKRALKESEELAGKKKLQKDLENERQRFYDIFLQAPQPMWVFDPETYRFIQVNKAAIELYGYSEEEFLSMTLMDIKLKEDIAKAKEDLEMSNHGNEVFERAIRHHKKSGEIIEVEIYSTPVLINDISYRSVIAIDITEKKLHEFKIIKAIIKTQEDERYEIGGELHDNICQLLATSQITLGMIKESIPAERMRFFDKSKEYITMALNEIRNLSHRLAPAFFDNSTLEEAFKRLLDSFNIETRYKILLHFNEAVNKHPVNQDIQLNLYRILQEQLKNILKYAKATIIKVDVLLNNNELKLRISDNGIGFNSNVTKEGIGLANMKRRTELFSGRFEVDSSPGNGCTVVVDIPLKENG